MLLVGLRFVFDVFNVSCAVDSRVAEKKLDWKVLNTLKVVPCCCW